MSTPEIWLSFLCITLATVVTRSGLLLAGRRFVIPPRVESALRYAPACALAAIIAPDLAVDDGALRLGLDNPRLLAGAAGIAIFALTRSTIGTILGGMIAFWLLTFGLPG
ncbi:MAG: AzlD domain-containing protein [Steroidobacteraceae bacterium]|jgi:branched-subunit amino acid transport protein|nr:AzlD domain-containing protein [Steroidobacteraceae bacterium]